MNRPPHDKPSASTPVRSTLRMLLLIWGLLFAHQAQAQAPDARPFILAYDESGGGEGSFTVKLFRQIYAEAFRRMGVPLEIVHYPTARLPLMLDRGMIDGEMARALLYGQLNPKLIRVSESVLVGAFVLYTAKPELRLSELKDLLTSTLRAEYRLGVLTCEGAMKATVSGERLSTIATTRQGLEKLLRDRTDVYCDIDLAVLNVLYGPPLQGAGALHTLLQIGDPAPLYPYLHPNHADMAPRLAATLKQMKLEGLLEQYRKEVLREFRH